MIFNSLYDRQLNIGNNFNSSFYTTKIIKDFYDSSKKLFKNKIELPEKYYFFSSIKFSKDGNYMVTVRYDELAFWNLNNPLSFEYANTMKTNCCIFTGAVLNDDSTKVIYCGNNYRKDLDLLVNDTNTGRLIRPYYTYSKVKSLSMNPLNNNIIAFANCHRKMFTYDLRNSALNELKLKDFNTRPIYSSIRYHPVKENSILVTTKDGLFSYDIRNNQVMMNYEIPYSKTHAHYAIYNKFGTQILVTVKDMYPILFNTNDSQLAFEFDEAGYYSPIFGDHCCFAGQNDEYVAAGSENYSLYVWEIPRNNKNRNGETILKKVNSAKFILQGHNSGINSVSYNHSKSILASIGNIDDHNLILWSPHCFTSDKNSAIKISDQNSFDRKPLRNIADSYATYFLTLKTNVFYTFDNSYSYYFKKIFNLKTPFIEKSFKENPSIKFIHTFIVNYKVSGYESNMKIMDRFDSLVAKNLVDGCTLYKHHLVLFFEVKKVFSTRHKVKCSLDFLKLHIKTANNARKKLIKINKKKSKPKFTEKLRQIDKIILIMKAMLYDLIIIYKLCLELYECAYELLTLLLKIVIKKINYNSLEKLLLETFIKDKRKIFDRTYVTDYNHINFFNLDFCSNIPCNKLDLHLNLSKHYNNVFLKKLSKKKKFHKSFKQEFRALK